MAYDISDKLHVDVGGNFYEGARNRPGYLRIADTINNVKAGLKYDLSSKISTHVSYEGVFYELTGATSANGRATKPQEQYLTFGAGLNLTSSAVLKLNYQIINFKNKGGFAAGTTGFGSPDGSGNATVLTTQLGVSF